MGKPLIDMNGSLTAPGPLTRALHSSTAAQDALKGVYKAQTDAEKIQHLQSAVLMLVASQQELIMKLTGMDS